MFVTAGGTAAAGRPAETDRATFFGHRTPGGGRSGSRRCFHHETIVLALIVGYAAAIWGCVGLRQWIVVFLTFRAGDQAADPAQAWTILVVRAVINFLGVPAGLIGNELSIRYGICSAEILSLAGFSIVPALLPQFIEAWSLTNTQAGWLAGITSAGYVLAVIPLVCMTDRRPARQLYLTRLDQTQPASGSLSQ